MLTNSEIRMLQEQHPTENDPMQFARAVIAAYEAKLREQEPVAWMNSDSFEKLLSTISCWTLVQKYSDAGFDIPLFLNPAPIPEGMVLVPTEPT